jgi:hypothetical protein
MYTMGEESHSTAFLRNAVQISLFSSDNQMFMYALHIFSLLVWSFTHTGM